jgi:two-component system, cell cycle sensor histidine kinase and response regulator CckA
MLSPTVLLHRLTVLVVDDEEPLRGYIARVMKEDGYNVISAGDGIEALILLENCRVPVQLVITDVSMPNMTGPELAGRISTLPTPPPVLFVSGTHGPPGLSGPLLQKPFFPEDLSRMVRRVLRRAPQVEPALSCDSGY